MANEEKKILTPEEKKREKELLEKEKAEKAQIDKMQKEKEKRRKMKEKRLKDEKKREIKRIKTLVNLPFKLLLHVSLLITMFLTIILYFWIELDLKTTLLYLFFIFSFIYFGVGGIMVAAFYLLSEDRKREMLEIKRLEQEKIEQEELKRIEEEELKLNELERDIAEKKNDSLKAKELLPELTEMNSQQSTNNVSEVYDESSPLMLEESAFSLPDDFDDAGLNDFLADEPATIEASPQANNEMNEMSYFEEIMSPEFEANLNK